MESQQKPRLEPRMVFATVLVAIPFLYAVAHVILIRSAEECSAGQEVGGLVQMLMPGTSCTEPLGPSGK